MNKPAAKTEKKGAESSGDKSTGDRDKSAGPKPTFGESIRETLDSIVIAFILAFLFRTFEAEAFVIPTGSMALTLMGAHKDHVCPECGTPYKVSASIESSENDHPQPVLSSMCPNCRYRHRYSPGDIPPTYNGDRILVTKYSYDFAEPQRYDVAVFKNPSQAKQNYIKRLVGLPHEEVMIWHGDIYIRKLDDEGKPIENAFRLARKPPEKALAVMQCVYDNDHVLPKLIELGWQPRWQGGVEGEQGIWKSPHQEKLEKAEKLEKGQAGAIEVDDLKTFRTVGDVKGTAWLRYHHLVPGEDAWTDMENGPLNDEQKKAYLKPQLITDFCEYNTYPSPGNRGDVTYLGLHWVGDLAIECELEFLTQPDDGEAVLELSEGSHRFQCRIAAKTGDATLGISGREGFKPTAKGAVSGAGPHRLRFGNVDDRLMLWVDDELVQFQNADGKNFDPIYQSQSTARHVEAVKDENGHDVYEGVNEIIADDTGMEPLGNGNPTTFDLESPVAIAATNCGLAASHLRVLRDVYYIADKGRMFDPAAYTPFYMRIPNAVSDYRQDVWADFRKGGGATPLDAERTLRAYMSDVTTEPGRWNARVAVSFTLDKDQFFMLGDNSQQSSDGRLWRGAGDPDAVYYVRRELLIGKALFVYWPHGWNTVPFTNWKLPTLPLLGDQYNPDFTRMRLIR